jgi:AraC family transcriptional regulator of adaptative response/methylated-DNA-[protein]-cysteine methyltransferase
VPAYQDRFPTAQLLGGDEDFAHAVATVVGYVEAPAFGVDLPFNRRGTAFQERVWEALRAIPAGASVSYADIAQCISAPNAVRAVAPACASNVLAVSIPCHRVVHNDRTLSGYCWDMKRKHVLLDRDAAS